MRPQINIEINDKIPDESGQKNKPDYKNSDDRDQIRRINKKKITGDEETVQLQNLSTAIETMNRK